MNDLAQSLVELCGSKLVALTDGSSGSVIATRDNVSGLLYTIVAHAMSSCVGGDGGGTSCW